MLTINPFYRFEDAIEVSSMSQGSKAISYGTYELSQNIPALGGEFIGNAINIVQNQVNIFNDLYSAINANWIVDVPNFPSSPNTPYNAQIFVYDTNIVKTFPLCKISIVLELDSSEMIVNDKTTYIGYVNEYYTFGSYLLPGEKDAYNALLTYSQAGSAIFPKWYVYDKTTKIATSLLANFKDCKLDATSGLPVREPADTEPRGNAPTIKLKPLDSDGKYIISLFEELIEFAGKPGISFIDIENEFPKWILPKNYSISFINDTIGYNRFQIDVYKNDNTFGYVLILREETTFLFQRFYTTTYSFYDFLANYTPSTSLPYNPNNYYLRYFNTFYDFDLCEFQECDYPAKEIYPMPIKPGDKLQFNVIPEFANVITDENISVGIFDKNFNLIQKVGESYRPTVDCDCVPCQIVLTYQILEEDWPQYISDVSQLNTFIATNLNFKILKNGNQIAFGGLSFVNPPDPYTFQNILEAGEGIVPAVVLTFEDGVYTFTYTLEDEAQCGDIYVMQNQISRADIIPTTWITIWESDPFECPTPTFTGNQYHSFATIPSLPNDCYRLGLYRFSSAIEGLKTIIPNQTINPANNYVLGLVAPSGIAQYLIAIPKSVNTLEDIASFLQDNLLFGTAVWDSNNLELTITIYPYIPLVGYYIEVGTYDYFSGTITGLTSTNSSAPPLGDENINELYAFSNLLELNTADCFSQIVQYWQTSDSIAEGFEYYGDWFQQVRLGINGGGKKSVITESVYRQSNGVFRRPSNKQDLSIDLHTDFLDFETQCALVDATRHANFVVNGQSLFVNGEIEIATIQDFTTQSSFEDLAQVKFSALIQGYQPKNSTCINC
jgi:hypothetical protein